MALSKWCNSVCRLALSGGSLVPFPILNIVYVLGNRKEIFANVLDPCASMCSLRLLVLVFSFNAGSLWGFFFLALPHKHVNLYLCIPCKPTHACIEHSAMSHEPRSHASHMHMFLCYKHPQTCKLIQACEHSRESFVRENAENPLFFTLDVNGSCKAES